MKTDRVIVPFALSAETVGAGKRGDDIHGRRPAAGGRRREGVVLPNVDRLVPVALEAH